MKQPSARLNLAIFLVLGVALRLYRLGYQSLWYDELFSVLVAKRSFPDMFSHLINGDVHPPLYYIFLHITLQVGQSDFTARLVSFLFASLSLPLFYFCVRRWLDEKTALAATGLLALSPFHVLFAQEARMYTLLGFWVLGMAWFFWQAWENGRLRDWSLFSLCAALALYTHNLAFLYLLAIDIFALLTGIRQRWRPLAMAHAGAFVLLLPWVWVWIGQAERVQAGFWAAPPSPLGLLLAIFLMLFGPSAPLWLVPVGLTAVLVLLGFLAGYLIRQGKIAKGILFPLTLFLVPLLVLYGLAFIRPIFVERIFLPASLGLYTLLAWGITYVPPVKLNRLTGGVLVLALAGTLVNYYTNPEVQKPPFRALAAQLNEVIVPGDVAVHTSDSSALALAWYAPELSSVSFYLAGDPDFEQMTARAYGGLGAGLRPLPPESFLADARRLWLVVALDHNEKYQREQVEWFDRQLARSDQLTVGKMDILRYDLSP